MDRKWTYRKGTESIPGIYTRWDVLDASTGQLLGWVGKFTDQNFWTSHVYKEGDFTGRQVGWEFAKTRREAAAEVWIQSDRLGY